MTETDRPWQPELPAVRRSASRRKKQRADLPGQPASLLVVSDRPDVLAEVSSLAGEEFDVQLADSIETALQALAGRDFDLLLTDQALRPTTGLQLLDRVRRWSSRAIGLLLVESADVEQASDVVRQGRAYACVLHPLRAERLLTTLRRAARHRQRERSQPNPRQAAELLARHAAELEEENRRLRQEILQMECQATTDPLTGLLNRRAIEALAENEVCRRTRYPEPLALGLIDADHFREINGRYLLPGGDQVLIGLSRALAGCLRAADRVGRVGGEEFLIVAPQTGLAGAGSLAERLRASVEQTSIHYNGQAIAVTVSVGFAVAERGEPADCNQLRHIAATALAEAKRAGRNCSVIRTLNPI